MTAMRGIVPPITDCDMLIAAPRVLERIDLRGMIPISLIAIPSSHKQSPEWLVILHEKDMK